MNSHSLLSNSGRNKPYISPAFASLLKRAVLWLAIFHFIAQLVIFFPSELARTDRERDLIVYYDAAVRLRDNVDVYLPWPEYGVQMTPSRFFYSPCFLLLTRPLAALSFVDFARMWLVLVFVAFWVYCFCLSRISTGKWDWKSAFVFSLIVDVLLKGHSSLSLGQFEPFMWMLFGLALTTRRRAGWLALATLVKIHPVWALALTLGEGGKREWKNAALFAIPVLLASFWLVGLHNWAMWWPSTQPVASQGTFNSDNWSLPFFGLRLLNWAGLLQASGTLPSWAKAYLSLCAVAGPLSVMWLTRKYSRELRVALVTCSGALFAPLCWTLYFPLLLLPIAVWLGEKGKRSSTTDDKNGFIRA